MSLRDTLNFSFELFDQWAIEGDIVDMDMKRITPTTDIRACKNATNPTRLEAQ